MKDVCLFAHYDKDDRVDDYVLWYLRNIGDLSFSIVFISTARLNSSDVARLRALCCDVILRENTGLDFGSWSAGFAKYGADINGRLLLANDSVYGPIGSLAAAINRLTSERADFYGLVESVEVAPHLQSWFLLFEPWVLKNAKFRAIFAQPFSAMTKKQIIARAEISILRQLTNAGFHYRALYEIRKAGLAARCFSASPMLFLWRELLCDVNVPFVKVRLITDNPPGVENARTIIQVVKQIDPKVSLMMKSHVRRMTDGRLPDKPRGSALWKLMRHSRSVLLRRGYHLSRENKHVAEMWNLVKLMPFIIVQRVLQGLRFVRLSN
jgi:lipopolysaccharide biosynthesis protein